MAARNPNDCAICGWSHEGGIPFPNYRQVHIPDGDVYRPALEANCPLCGRYFLTGPLKARYYQVSIVPKELTSSLSCATRQASESGDPLEITEENAQRIAEAHANTRISDNIDRLLREIAKRSVRPGGLAVFNPETDFSLIDCYSSVEFQQYFTWLEQAGHIRRILSGHAAQFNLTMEGWIRVQPLPRPGGIPGRCFVAMAFDPTLNNVFDLGIKPAVVIDCGFSEPVRIDRQEHNNQITDEMIAAIRDAEFMIADLTLQRQSVYFEAGFARGLGREVIYSCRDDDFDNRHFDVEQVKAIKWATVTDLREQLARRIKATIIPMG